MELTIKRGDIFFASDFDPNDPKPGRPVLVVSSDYGNRASNHISVVPLSRSNDRIMGTHVKVVCRELSTALCENVTTIPRRCFGDYIRTATDAEMEQIDRALQCALGLQMRGNPGANLEKSGEDLVRAEIERDVYKGIVEKLIFDPKVC